MKLAVQIITYKSSGHLLPLLESLKKQTYRDFEVWFWDNSVDTDEAEYSRALVNASGVSTHFIVSEKNVGFAGGHAAMFRCHEAPFVMLLNDDAVLDPAYLEATMARIESDQKMGSVTGLVYRQEPERTIDTAGLEYVCLAQIVDRWAGEMMSRAQIDKLCAEEVFGVSGAVGLYRRSAIETAGGLFDPKWFMYKEDVDLALRLREAGFSAWFEPKAIAWHKRGLQQQKNMFTRFINEWKRLPVLRQSAYVNQWRIYKRHFKWSLGISDLLFSLVIEFMRSVGTFVVSPIVFFKSWYAITRA
jgi:GT2 family glycosyltransferase